MRKTLLLYIIPLFLLGDFAKVGTAGAKFLGLEVGARAAGMAGSYIGIGNDASLIFWDPAELTKVKGVSLFTGYTNLFAGIKHSSFSIALNKGLQGTYGFFASGISIGGMDETTVDSIDGTGNTFGYTGFTTGFSFAKALTDKFSLGFNLKFIGEYYGNYTKTYGWGFDVGTLYYTGWKSFRFGMIVQNFGPDLKPSGTYLDYINGSVDDTLEFSPYPIPMTFRLGGAMNLYETDNSYLTLSACLVHPNDNIENVRIGTEYGFNNMLFLRAGYSIRTDEEKMSFGFGVKTPNNRFSIDYAFTDMGALPDLHRISAAMSF